LFDLVCEFFKNFVFDFEMLFIYYFKNKKKVIIINFKIQPNNLSHQSPSEKKTKKQSSTWGLYDL